MSDQTEPNCLINADIHEGNIGGSTVSSRVSDKTVTNDPIKTEGYDPRIVPMDSFERIEAEILQEAVEGSRMSSFADDYRGIAEETTFDEQIASARGIRKQPNLDELAALDLQWQLEHQREIAEKALERLEVAELIKKAEEKLIPIEEDSDASKDLPAEALEELARETEELSPELVMLNKIISAADLLRMESSDMSEEEGFRLRLSCIMEESESDSGSGVIKNKQGEIHKLPFIEQPPKKASLADNIIGPSDKSETNVKSSIKVDETKSIKSDTDLDTNSACEQYCALDNSQVVAENVKQTSVETKECIGVENVPDSPAASQEIRLSEADLSQIFDRVVALDEERDHIDSVGSSSPEPNFEIQRLKSGTKIDKSLTRPSLKKKIDSSSDSSLDISTATASPSVEDAAKSIETLKEVSTRGEIQINENSGVLQSVPNNEVAAEIFGPDTEIPESIASDNADLSANNERIAMDASSCDITEVTEEEIPANVSKVRRSRGKSEEKEIRQRSDSQSIKSFDIRGAAARMKAMFPKFKKGRRGASLESGMAEKKRQEKEKLKLEENVQITKRSQKGESEPPPVPPETYLWEELRRWRIKGGYPWTHLDKAPFDEKAWKAKTDHEYEPVNPPPLESTPGTSEPAEGNDVEFNEKHFLRIPRDDELVVSPEDMEVEAIGAARQFQDDLEDRFLATPMTATTASRTDCDVNTSMLDSSGLEDLPLKRDSRSKKALQSKTEQMRAQAQGLQQRIRTQAGKLRNKLRSLPRPSFPKRERSRPETAEDKPQSRFRMPERPKFSLPERPKFKMPQKPKLNLQSLTKPLRERQSQNKPGDTKRNLFEVDFKTYPRIFNKKSKERGEYSTSSPKMARSGTPPPAPLQPARKKGPVGQRWVNRFDDIRYVDDRASELSQPSGRSDRSESLSGFHDRDFAMADELDNVGLPPPRAVSLKSSVSRASEPEPQSSRSSVEGHERGVLEEIDDDQFFLRQKGLSENDINMEKYLSEEIREAFRSPVVNALRSLDLDYEDGIRNENIDVKENAPEPLPPSRTRSLKKGQRIESIEEPIPKPSISELETDKARYQNIPENVPEPKSRYENIIEDNTSEYYKSPPSPVEYQHYKVPRPTPAKRKSASTEKMVDKKKQNGWVEVEVETELEAIGIDVDDAPQTLPRRKSKKSIRASQSVDIPGKVEATLARPEVEPDYIVPDNSVPEAPKRRRSQSREARSLHSLAQDENAPIPPKRTSSRSIHTIGLKNELPSLEPDTRSVRSLALDERRVQTVPRRFKSLGKGSRSVQSLAHEESSMLAQHPTAPERTRSLSRASRTAHSNNYLADDEKSWVPQAPERPRSLSRKSMGHAPTKEDNEVERLIEKQIDHYEMPTENGYDDYAVVEKIKPPRPPPPRRLKGSRSPNFNTFPRRSPVRPVRNYATLGPSRPPRKERQAQRGKSVEHIYSSDAISESYAQIDSLHVPQTDDLNGSNKDLQAIDVVEKMKVRPLPAPPRPPRLKTKSEEQNLSMEVVEEVCASTQTDPLPDDVCLEDDMMQEFSHDQLRIQEAFLKEMREEEERIQSEIESKRARHMDVTAETEENEAKMEIIRQMGDIIQEERRLLDDDRRAQLRYSPELKKAEHLQVEEDDMGYASLDRRQPKVEVEPQPSTSFQQPATTVPQVTRISPEQPAQHPQLQEIVHETQTVAPSQLNPVYIPLVPEIVSTERLRVGHLEVERISVSQLEAINLTIQNTRTQTVETPEIRSAALQVQEITSHSGNLAIRNVELPPDFIRELIARIPWEEIRPPPQPRVEAATTPCLPKTPSVEEEPLLSSHSSQATTTRRRRRIRKTSRNQDTSDEEAGQVVLRRPARVGQDSQDSSTVGELSQQLARACTSATVHALNSFAQRVAPPSAGEARTRYVQLVLLVALVAVAGYILMGWGGRSVHHHHWDFQFPPQPEPPRQ